MKKFLFLFIFFSLLIGSAAVAGLGWFWWNIPMDSSEETVEFRVEGGQGFSSVADALEQKGLLRWAPLFKAYVKFAGHEVTLKEGTYELSRALKPKQILDKLVKGEVRLVTFVIPEGFNMWQVAERLAAKFPNISLAQWNKAMTDPKHLSGLPPEAETLEGYLFPETYKVREKPTIKEVLDSFKKAFHENLTDEIQAEGKNLGLGLHQLVTLASIIEKETGKPSERPRIASVFHNRMRKKMKLQTDPTVIYGIWERYDGNIRKIDLQTPTPYNTYVIDGLPPGPIANPGKEALAAAVDPLSTEDIYFVGRGDGSHVFSRTLQEHNAAVYQFQVKPFRSKTKN